MSANQKIEIDDLISDAVANAVARRNDMQILSGEEASSISGGLVALNKDTDFSNDTKIKSVEFKPYPLVVGLVAYEPPCTTVGKIAKF